jgi:hypothetical protein
MYYTSTIRSRSWLNAPSPTMKPMAPATAKISAVLKADAVHDDGRAGASRRAAADERHSHSPPPGRRSGPFR